MDEAQIRVQWRSMGHIGAEKVHLALRQKAAQDGTQAPTLAAVREAIRVGWESYTGVYGVECPLPDSFFEDICDDLENACSLVAAPHAAVGNT